jgi:RecJ-like exonuclease
MGRTYEQIMQQIHDEAKHMCLSPAEMAAWEEQAIDAARAEAEQPPVLQQIPCPRCDGSSEVYDPCQVCEERGDQAPTHLCEGTMIPCPVCRGGTKKVYVEE